MPNLVICEGMRSTECPFELNFALIYDSKHLPTCSIVVGGIVVHTFCINMPFNCITTLTQKECRLVHIGESFIRIERVEVYGH